VSLLIKEAAPRGRNLEPSSEGGLRGSGARKDTQAKEAEGPPSSAWKPRWGTMRPAPVEAYGGHKSFFRHPLRTEPWPGGAKAGRTRRTEAHGREGKPRAQPERAPIVMVASRAPGLGQGKHVTGQDWGRRRLDEDSS